MPLGAFRGFGAKHQKTAPPRPYTLRVGADRGILMRKKSGKFGVMKKCCRIRTTAQSNPPWIVERLSPGRRIDAEPGQLSTGEHMSEAFKTQIDGNHYSKLAIQPMQYSMANKLDACQHTIIKYVTRFRDKNGRVDLEKAKHVIDMLIALEYGES